MKTYLSSVYSYKLSYKWWRLSRARRKSIISGISTKLNQLKKRPEVKKAEFYTSLRHDSDLIFWIMSAENYAAVEFRAYAEKLLDDNASIRYGLISLYKENPSQTAKKSNTVFFVAYPVKKSADWYALSKADRSEIMAEHINVATSNPHSRGIVSYTTHSFGLDDSDFVVIYELPSLLGWVETVELLRGVRARKWIIKEDPVIVGSNAKFDSLLY
ncbi:MAG: chlorite dismutase family protein [Candidatus Marsarchaeota archaeon]|jgi:chlorite dismutase|nr:chlorite dismutase family protein [Candidatus Marsarchaeota archaeon]MCL5418949.1 chlorite dismutase family protein [Candidatus Marsarchaeota archaeon]